VIEGRRERHSRALRPDRRSPAGIELKRKRREQSCPDFQELDRERQQSSRGKAAMTFVKSFGQGKGEFRLAPGSSPSFAMPSFIREGIGRFKRPIPECRGRAL